MSLFGRKSEARLRVGGMTCAHCRETVERALQGVPGVAQARVDLAAGEAVVRYDPQQAAVDRLVAAVREAGYDAVPG